MTFKINPELWDALPGHSLKREFEEFASWFCSNMNDLSKNDRSAGWALLLELKGLLEERNIDTTEYSYLESAAASSAQISFFPAR